MGSLLSNRFKMLSLYLVLVLALSLNVDGKCQSGESSLCFVADMPDLKLTGAAGGLSVPSLRGAMGTSSAWRRTPLVSLRERAARASQETVRRDWPARPAVRGERSARREFVLFLSSSERTVSSQRVASPGTVGRA